MPKFILAIWGVSGAGKSSLASTLVKASNGLCAQIKTTTTRPKRTPREDTYHFVTKAEFRQLHTFATAEFAGNYYGTNLADVKRQLKARQSLVTILTWSGVQAYVNEFRHTDIRVVPVWLDCPLSDARERIDSRKDSHITDTIINQRFQSYRHQYHIAMQSNVPMCRLVTDNAHSKQTNSARELQMLKHYLATL